MPHRHGREDEERVLISEVLIRNKDGEELERKDLEAEAAAALKACVPNSALTVREVQEDVHRIIDSGYFCSCMPVAIDTRDGIRLVFQVCCFRFRLNLHLDNGTSGFLMFLKKKKKNNAFACVHDSTCDQLNYAHNPFLVLAQLSFFAMINVPMSRD